MEVLIILFLLFGGWRLVVWLIKVGGGAAADVAKGRASFGDAVTVRTKGMSQLEVMVEEETVGDQNLPVWKVRVRGLFQIASTMDLAVVISVLDVTEKNSSHPVLAALDDFQEEESRAFQFIRGLGICEPGQGFLHWVDVGVVPKDLLIYPHSGTRNIAIIARVVDTNQMPEIELGFADPHQSGIIQYLSQVVPVPVDRGFLESSQEDLGVAGASIRLGLAIAYADGGMDPLEARVVKEWSSKFVNEVPAGRGRDDARDFINDVIRYGNEDAKAQNLSISQQVEVLNQLADKPVKYAAIELCFDVMAADGTADPSELKVLNRLCDSLGLDSDRFSELRDHRMINVESAAVDGANVWEILGIDGVAPREVKKAKLKSLYRRWNSRAESLEVGEERERAHEMLEIIAKARSLLNA